LTPEQRDHIKGRLPEVYATTKTALGLLKGCWKKYRTEISIFGNFPSLFLGLCAEDGTWEHYGGRIRIVDSNERVVADKLEPRWYMDYIGEAVEPYSYLKSPYYKPLGYPDGICRVGPLAACVYVNGWVCLRPTKN